VIGKKTDSSVMELKLGPISQNLRATTSMARSMELALFSGEMVQCTLESFTAIISRA
jgi:hypothetical protein